MAYISHSGKSNKSSHYDWHILIVIILLLVSILTFVVVKFVFPELFADPQRLDTTQQQQSTPIAEPVSAAPTHTVAAQPATQQRASAPATKPSTAVKKEASQAVSADKPQEKPAAKPVVNEALKCSDSDRLAGLCS